MSSEPTYPKDDAPVGDAAKLNETLDIAVAAKEAEEEAEKAKGGNKRSFVKGAAVGVGSAALVAALLYANRARRDKS